MVFNKKWFGQHQKTLLFLLNNKFTRFIFRKILRIDVKDNILALLPNALFIKGNKENEYVAEFRTHDKYAKRLYYAFKPIWYIIHAWDMLFANNLNPNLNLGFDTLTVYPRSITTTNPIDGFVSRNSPFSTFSQLRDGAGTQASTTGDTARTELDSSGNSNTYIQLDRGVSCFDTSSLTSLANISVANIQYRGTAKGNGLGSPSMHSCSASPASTSSLSATDYTLLGTTSFGSVDYASFSISGYNAISLNSSGIANISKTGISKFGTRLSWDINNNTTGLTWATISWSGFNFRNANYTGTSQDPMLVITYTLASAFLPQIIFM